MLRTIDSLVSALHKELTYRAHVASHV